MNMYTKTKETNSQNITFLNILNTISGQNFKSNEHDYLIAMKAYNRRNRKIKTFLSEKHLQANAKKLQDLKLFLHAIYVFQGTELMPHEKRVGEFKRTRPLTFQYFICRLLKTESPQKVSPRGTSFFLRFFKEDSELAQKVPSPVSSSQQPELQKLIADETAAPQERFLRLIELIMKD